MTHIRTLKFKYYSKNSSDNYDVWTNLTLQVVLIKCTVRNLIFNRNASSLAKGFLYTTIFVYRKPLASEDDRNIAHFVVNTS